MAQELIKSLLFDGLYHWIGLVSTDHQEILESDVDCPAFLAFGFEEGVVQDFVDACTFSVAETQAIAEETCEME